jgi:formate C-acetyltransferase
MNERLENLKQKVRAGEQRKYRKDEVVDILPECEKENLSWMRRAARLTIKQCAAETPIIEPDERIVYTRTLPSAIPEIYNPEKLANFTAGKILHELGPVNNVSPDWGNVLAVGLMGKRQTAISSRNQYRNDPMALDFLDCAVATIDSVLGLTRRYAEEALRKSRKDLADILERVPAYAPRTFLEALQSLRLLHSITYVSGHYQIGFGRFDQYMWPYLQSDLENGRVDMDDAYEQLAEFFISLNKDSDLYPGVQQGDNGQTITLGGVDRSGKPAVNELTKLCLQVSRDVCMIDPKINLRISSATDLEILSLATELTSKGLGFPQYSNDDVVIPGLVAHGYQLEDARDYAVAACWEFIIPGKGMDVVNIGAVSFPAAVDSAIRTAFAASGGMQEILAQTQKNIEEQVNHITRDYENLLLPPAPYLSVLMSDCLETGKDISQGARYNNFGLHGAGAANAADALAAVQELIFQQDSVKPADLLTALDQNFQNWENLQHDLLDKGPKVGNDDNRADDFLVLLFEMMADACEHYGTTSRGGILRPGSGSAMYYIWLTQGHEGMREPLVGATAEGRKKGEPLGANLAPSQGVQIRGPFSVLFSFAKINYRRICNGGPITLEISNTVFRDAESIRKVAMLVRAFAQLNCQQLQINSMNLDTLLDAKIHPENHRNLIVRVWGWSGYFCELSPEYQDQIIARHIYKLN